MDFFMQGFHLFSKGGPVMYILLLCSIAVGAIAIERYSYYRTAVTDAIAFSDELQKKISGSTFAETAVFCEQSQGVVAQIAAAGMKASQYGGDLENSLEGAASIAEARLREYLNYLSMIVTLAPLLGLLGTVIGMIHSFSVLNIQSGQPLAITGGVGEALIATATGLSVAILALLVHSYFTNKLEQLVTDMEQVSTVVVTEVRRRGKHEVSSSQG